MLGEKEALVERPHLCLLAPRARQHLFHSHSARWALACSAAAPTLLRPDSSLSQGDSHTHHCLFLGTPRTLCCPHQEHRSMG